MNLREVSSETLLSMYRANSKHIEKLYLKRKNIEKEINKRVEILRLSQERGN
jgi:hypothetical protein